MTMAKRPWPRIPAVRQSLITRLINWSSVCPETGCWIWQRTKSADGYGTLCLWTPRNKPKRSTKAHRLAYEEFVGPIPDGLQIDHLCRNRACICPDHMEPVTQQENVMRGDAKFVSKRLALQRTHCKNGHEYTAENTAIYQNNHGRRCRECNRMQCRKYHQAVIKQRIAA